MNWLLALEGVVLFVAGGVTANTLDNVRGFRRLASFAAPVAAPFVSVLVPARDEAANIAACVRSLATQHYDGQYEIIVLDDESSDDTAAIVRELVREYPHASLVVGHGPPPGWTGKVAACHALSERARSDILLFTDADTVHAPTMLAHVAGAFAAGAAVVTALPQQEIGGWSEALAVPTMLATLWVFLPIRFVGDARFPQASACGQLLAFTRDAYATVGGHAAVHDSVLEDMQLARRAKECGLRLCLTDGVGIVRTRMYRDTRAVWRGFAKNTYLALGASPVAAASFALLLSLMYLLPVVTLVAGGAMGRGGWAWRGLPLLLLGAMLVQGAVVAVRARLAWWQVPLQPARVLFFLLVLANAMRWHRRGFGEWKGRRYITTAPRVMSNIHSREAVWYTRGEKKSGAHDAPRTRDGTADV